MADFHFIRPLWLLAIIALLFAVYLLKKYRLNQSGWQQLLPSHLSKILLDEQQDKKSLSISTTIIIPFIIGLLTIIALAGPTWQKLPQPVFQLARGSVLIMDMSYSMLATDLTPNRLTRARYKATDLLDNLNEGQMGLIAYAGDAFVISPLTEDINNIKLLLPSLSPDIMPELGSNPLAALTLAHEMLLNAGHPQGDIYWFTDGIDQEDLQDITKWSRSTPHRLNILGIGSKAGAPIKLTNGELMKDDAGAIIIPKLPESLLYGSAKRGRGKYQSITNDSQDIDTLLSQSLAKEKQDRNSSNEMNDDQANEENPSIGDQWQETGPYLVLLILPLLLIYFRRGNLVALLPLSLFLFPNEQAYADSWQDLWKTNDQQAQQKFNREAYNEAAQQFEDPLWQGTAHYKAGDFEKALAAFKEQDSAQALYNQGNALAKLNKLDQAIEAYDNALEKNPDLDDAKANKTLLEQLKKQQEQQEQENKDNQDQQDQDSKDQQDESKQDQQNQEQKNKDQQQQDQQDSENNNTDKQNGDQQDKEASENKEQQSEKQKSKEEQQKEKEKEQKQAEEAEKQQEESDNKEGKEAQSQQAKLAEEKLAQEKEQKHQQLLNKVTDDPYLLLRNKMQLEYQKRRQNQSSLGAKKKW
jgi:Ca-activated chloride channel family protein